MGTLRSAADPAVSPPRPRPGRSWSNFAMFMGMYFITGCFGITLSYHRQARRRGSWLRAQRLVASQTGQSSWWPARNQGPRVRDPT